MNKNLKISVVVPVYNVEEYIRRCLDSIINQSFRDIEIICVNDGSTDQSLKILTEYAVKDNRIKIINQENKGLSEARNTGISVASGKYITFVDSDDWIESDMFETLYLFSLKNDCDVSICSYFRNYLSKEIPKVLNFPDEIVYDKKSTHMELLRKVIGPINEEIAHPENLDSIVTAWGKLYRLKVIKENNLRFIDTKEIGTEDLLFNIYYLTHSDSSGIINRPLYHYWKGNSSSLTTTYKENLSQQWMKKYEYIYQYLIEHEFDNLYCEALKNRICLATLGLGLNEICIKSFNEIPIRIRNYSNILKQPYIRESFRNFDLNYLPLHWKIFYFFNKKGLASLSIIMLFGINILRKYKK